MVVLGREVGRGCLFDGTLFDSDSARVGPAEL